ncbi:hypothetical protein EDB80DRAFT_877288 [Ilyonectria destructans]|nr:hypothetical protein EDB80DRAFT_877288 [Ilyonectria destructans]
MADEVKFINKLEGSRILIVGGSTGAGYGVAEASIELGAAAVIISSSNNSRVQDAVAQLRSSYPSKASRVSGFACNLAQEDVLEHNLAALLDAATSNGQHKLDPIAFTAGDTLSPTALKDVDLEYLKKYLPHSMLRSNPSHQARCKAYGTQPFLQHHLRLGFPLLGMMSGGMRSLVRGLALELKPLRVNVAALGAVNTSGHTLN